MSDDGSIIYSGEEEDLEVEKVERGIDNSVDILAPRVKNLSLKSHPFPGYKVKAHLRSLT
eukprot:5445048-Ditylum_brightwellii.AAC.1